MSERHGLLLLMEEELRLEIAKLRLEVARQRRALDRLALMFEACAKIMRLEELADPVPPRDPTSTPLPRQIRRLDRRRRPA
jgi:hypothetical protein